MPSYTVSEAEIASLAAYRAMVARHRAGAADLGRALFVEDAPVEDASVPNYAALMGRELAAVNAETVRLYLLVLRALAAREVALKDGED